MTTDIAERDDPENEQERRRTGLFQFFKEVRAEGRKVTWASRNETLISTVMLVIMVVVMAVFFFLVDSLLLWMVGLILGLNS